MKLRLWFTLLVLAVMSLPALAWQGQPSQKAPQPSVEEIIQRMAKAESENRDARQNYTFTQDVDVMTLGPADSITGRFRRVSDIVLDNRGNRVEKITFFPPSTLTEVSFTATDMQDLAGVQPFTLTAEDLPKYDVKYIGKERVDELGTYVFEVKPKRIVKGERYFEGRIWVDDQDFQAVKAKGQAVPEDEKNQYPHFESYRENIDGRYWFPTYVYADDILEFKNSSVRLRMVIRYKNYKKFSTDIRLVDEPDTDGNGGTNPRK